MTSRRHFLKTAGLYSAGFVGLRTLVNQPLFAALSEHPSFGYGPLMEEDAAAMLRLPRGFRCVAFSRAGEEMDDGLLVPGKHDGMAAFAGPDGRTLLVRNHELDHRFPELSPFGADGARLDRIDRRKLYDGGKGVSPILGGTSTLVFETRSQKLERHFLSLAGTVLNCAGGPTPWGTWVTCEEIREEPEPNAEQLHGYTFEVTPSTEIGLVDPVPLKAMGRFRHEAVAVDPASGAVYETEDLGDGLIYRFLPDRPGELAAGGRLQALALAGRDAADTRNWQESALAVGQPLPVRWIDLDEIDSPNSDLRFRGAAKGAAVFARGEGAWWGNDSVYFAMTNGGRKKTGQIFRYRPSPHEGSTQEKDQPGLLELFAEPNDSELLSNCDNLTVAPWGDLVICEDTSNFCRVLGVTPQGEFYVIASSLVPGREFAGACFSPDGSTLFVNVQSPGYTVAITGPWAQPRT